ncbi:MAG: selenocysteine-specific translation elongation factor [Actinomycetota bacterium]
MAEAALRVVATAGHVDHGKSSLIVRLTGIDPDRWEEEKRRGLTIDLGFAWCALPSGREIGFVDVPGHERFIRNMLAGVGPVRDVLFVVAADEGWKPQSEEHLEILDLLGAHGVVALTKADLVDEETLAIARDEVRERTRGTVLADAPIVACSAATGAGLDDLRAALDELVGRIPADGAAIEDVDRARLHVDRVFTIRGAGTVVTGTLTGGALTVGEEVELLPDGRRARIRGLQSHERQIEQAVPVSRVAVNLAGVDRDDVERGAVLTRPGAFAGTAVVDVRLTPVRSLSHPITARGAYKVYAGAAEIDTRLRLLGSTRLDPDGTAFARLHLARPHAFAPFDLLVLREAGRRETVAGGRVLDLRPTRASAADTVARLERRDRARAAGLPELLLRERGAIRADDAVLLTGVPGIGGPWLIDDDLRAEVHRDVTAHLEAFHRANPLRGGDELSAVRATTTASLARHGGPRDHDLADTMLDELAEDGTIVRSATAVRLSAHTVALDETDPRLTKLIAAVGRHPEQPPTVKQLVASGTPPELIDAAAASGAVVQVAPDLVFVPSFVDEATRAVRATPEGITVSGFRERLGTSRKYAVPLLEFLDRTGVTRRDGDLRFPRSGDRSAG